MSKKNRRKDKGVPMEKRSTTFLPPIPRISVMPDDKFYGKGEYEAAAEAAKDIEDMLIKQNSMIQSSSGFGRSSFMPRFSGGNTQAKQQVSLEERVHNSYTHDKEKNAFISVDGLALHVPEVINAPYLPGFVLVNMDDPMALYCLGNYWYTPNAGKNSLEILAEHFAKKLMALESNTMFYASGGGGGGNIQSSPMTNHKWSDPANFTPRPNGALSMKGLEDFINIAEKEQNES